jgi:thymidylate synthase (FAD)
MRVLLIAHTVITGWGNMRDAGWLDYQPADDEPIEDYENRGDVDADHLAEFGGRLCYQSWERPNPKTATNAGYLNNIIGQQHFSVLEHASATFYLDGISRSLTHELVRHRHLSFSQVSQRYVDSSDVTFVQRPEVDRAAAKADIHLGVLASSIMDIYVKLNDQLMADGMTRKEARQAARWILPNATETKILVTGNMRAWRDVIAKRNTPHADHEIHALAAELLKQLKEIAPSTFQDME